VNPTRAVKLRHARRFSAGPPCAFAGDPALQEGSPLTALAGSFHLLPRETKVAPIDVAALDIASFDTPPPARREPNHALTALFSVGVIAGAAANSFHESPHRSFPFTEERFFAQNTYAGGADKASHFVDYAILSKELKNVYGLHLVFDNIRLPYTSVGFRYDLNHDQWRGPDNGNRFRSP
jgi:hypothetical protein